MHQISFIHDLLSIYNKITVQLINEQFIALERVCVCVKERIRKNHLQTIN